MQRHFTLTSQRVVRIIVLIIIACAIGLAAGRNSNSVSTSPQSRAASYDLILAR